MKYKDEYAVKVEGLRKCYGPHPVLKGLDFQIRRGEIFGLIGINGAGKTTALECMEGFRRYDGGRICVNGRIGVQLQSASLPAYMKAMEAVRLFAAWKQTKPDPSVLSALEISRQQKKNYGELSHRAETAASSGAGSDRRPGDSDPGRTGGRAGCRRQNGTARADPQHESTGERLFCSPVMIWRRWKNCVTGSRSCTGECLSLRGQPEN